MSIWSQLSDTDFQLTFVDAGGIRTRAIQAGPKDAEHVVFLHGTSGHLEAFVRNLPAHAAHYRCHAIDMLGHGYSDKPDYPYEIPRYVEHLLAYLDAVGVDRAHLIGESLGGWVASWTGSERPERVRSLQLLCMGGTKIDPEVMERLKTSTTAAVIQPDRDLTRQRLRLLWAEWDSELGDELTDVRYAIYHQAEFQRNLHNLLALQEVDVRQRNLLTADRMGQITAPTLIVWGSKNPFGAIPEANAINAAIPGSRLEVFGQTGHWPQHEQAQRYNALSLDFLAGVTAAAQPPGPPSARRPR